MPLVSIIVPVFNVEEYLHKCLRSISRQTLRDIEIICVNSLSTDNSVTIVKNAALKDNRIRLINTPVDDGLGGARNAGLRAATGEYIQFVDSDDYISPRMTETLVRAIEKQGVDYAFCALRGFDDASGQPFEFERPFHSAKATQLAVTKGVLDLRAHAEVLTDIYPSAWLPVRKRADIERIGADFPVYRLAEDHRFHYLCGFQSASAFYVDEPLYFHRRNRPGQLSLDATPRALQVFDTIEENAALFDKFLPKDQAERAKIKIAMRLLYEKLGQFEAPSTVRDEFFARANALLEPYGLENIYASRDHFILTEHIRLLTGFEPLPLALGRRSNVVAVRSRQFKKTMKTFGKKLEKLPKKLRDQMLLPRPVRDAQVSLNALRDNSDYIIFMLRKLESRFRSDDGGDVLEANANRSRRKRLDSARTKL